MPQCRSVMESRKARCESQTFWNSPYCRRHTPKYLPFITACYGVLLGSCLAVIVHLAFGHMLPRFWPFHYLDIAPPEVLKISPDIRLIKQVDPSLQFFQIQFQDSGSGLDFTKSQISIKKDLGGHLQMISSQAHAEAATLKLELKDKLDAGNYFLEASAYDRMGHEVRFLDTFTVERNPPLRFQVRLKKFETDPDRDRFQSLVTNLDPGTNHFMVFHLTLHQQAEKATVRNVKVEIQLPAAIHGFQEIGSKGTDRPRPFPPDKPLVSRRRIYDSRKWIEIGEMDPGSVISFLALVIWDSDIETLERMPIAFNGSYDYEGFRDSGPRNVSVWVPVEKEVQP